MHHFDQLAPDTLDRLFVHAPTFVPQSGRKLGAFLGAALYLPSAKRDLTHALVAQRSRGVVAMVLDLEDGVADGDVAEAQDRLASALREVDRDRLNTPRLFVRVRAHEQIASIIREAGTAADRIAGFVLPKFEGPLGEQMLQSVVDVNDRWGLDLTAMPVLEGGSLSRAETRLDTLLEAARIVSRHAHVVTAVRIGATDIAGTFGLRRGPDLTVYDLTVVRDAIADIVNVFSRPESDVPVISGCVWEYFSPSNRVLRPTLRATPFGTAHARWLRQQLMAEDADALIHEVVLDKANGLTGKTVIHPSHTTVVHALSSVTYEEARDARDILSEDGGGAQASTFRNKMNEPGPHRRWAERIAERGDAFGVLAEEFTFADLLDAQASV